MIKGKKYLKKQAVASVLALSMAAASLTGCSNGLSSSKKESSNVGTMTQEEASTTKVMVIGDYGVCDSGNGYEQWNTGISKGKSGYIQGTDVVFDSYDQDFVRCYPA